MPLGLPRKKIAEARSQLCSKGPSSENFLATGGFFESNTYRIIVLGWLKKKEEDEQF